jgi:hypothetical protein
MPSFVRRQRRSKSQRLLGDVNGVAVDSGNTTRALCAWCASFPLGCNVGLVTVSNSTRGTITYSISDINKHA